MRRLSRVFDSLKNVNFIEIKKIQQHFIEQNKIEIRVHRCITQIFIPK